MHLDDGGERTGTRTFSLIFHMAIALPCKEHPGPSGGMSPPPLPRHRSIVPASGLEYASSGAAEKPFDRAGLSMNPLYAR